MSRHGHSSCASKQLELSRLDAKREEKRKRLRDLFDQHRLIRLQMDEVEKELAQLDDEIDQLETILSQNETHEKEEHAPINVVQPEFASREGHSDDRVVTAEPFTYSLTQAEEILTEPTTQMRASSTQHPDEVIPDPCTQNADQLVVPSPNFYRPLSRTGSVGPLELNVTMRESQKKAPPPLATLVATASTETRQDTQRNATATSDNRRTTGTLDNFILGRTSVSSAAATQTDEKAIIPGNTTAGNASRNRVTPSISSNDSMNARRDAHHHLSGDHFPWSQQVQRHLQETFRIPSFRDNQKEIINATMSGEDVFVIMRTGGGKVRLSTEIMTAAHIVNQLKPYLPPFRLALRSL